MLPGGRHGQWRMETSFCANSSSLIPSLMSDKTTALSRMNDNYNTYGEKTSIFFIEVATGGSAWSEH